MAPRKRKSSSAGKSNSKLPNHRATRSSAKPEPMNPLGTTHAAPNSPHDNADDVIAVSPDSDHSQDIESSQECIVQPRMVRELYLLYQRAEILPSKRQRTGQSTYSLLLSPHSILKSPSKQPKRSDSGRKRPAAAKANMKSPRKKPSKSTIDAELESDQTLKEKDESPWCRRLRLSTGSASVRASRTEPVHRDWPRRQKRKSRLCAKRGKGPNRLNEIIDTSQSGSTEASHTTNHSNTLLPVDASDVGQQEHTTTAPDIAADGSTMDFSSSVETPKRPCDTMASSVKDLESDGGKIVVPFKHTGDEDAFEANTLYQAMLDDHLDEYVEASNSPQSKAVLVDKFLLRFEFLNMDGSSKSSDSSRKKVMDAFYRRLKSRAASNRKPIAKRKISTPAECHVVTATGRHPINVSDEDDNPSTADSTQVTGRSGQFRRQSVLSSMVPRRVSVSPNFSSTQLTKSSDSDTRATIPNVDKSETQLNVPHPTGSPVQLGCGATVSSKGKTDDPSQIHKSVKEPVEIGAAAREKDLPSAPLISTRRRSRPVRLDTGKIVLSTGNHQRDTTEAKRLYRAMLDEHLEEFAAVRDTYEPKTALIDKFLDRFTFLGKDHHPRDKAAVRQKIVSDYRVLLKRRRIPVSNLTRNFNRRSTEETGGNSLVGTLSESESVKQDTSVESEKQNVTDESEQDVTVESESTEQDGTVKSQSSDKDKSESAGQDNKIENESVGQSRVVEVPERGSENSGKAATTFLADNDHCEDKSSDDYLECETGRFRRLEAEPESSPNGTFSVLRALVDRRLRPESSLRMGARLSCQLIVIPRVDDKLYTPLPAQVTVTVEGATNAPDPADRSVMDLPVPRVQRHRIQPEFFCPRTVLVEKNDKAKSSTGGTRAGRQCAIGPKQNEIKRVPLSCGDSSSSVKRVEQRGVVIDNRLPMSGVHEFEDTTPSFKYLLQRYNDRAQTGRSVPIQFGKTLADSLTIVKKQIEHFESAVDEIEDDPEISLDVRQYKCSLNEFVSFANQEEAESNRLNVEETRNLRRQKRQHKVDQDTKNPAEPVDFGNFRVEFGPPPRKSRSQQGPAPTLPTPPPSIPVMTPWMIKLEPFALEDSLFDETPCRSRIRRAQQVNESTLMELQKLKHSLEFVQQYAGGDGP